MRIAELSKEIILKIGREYGRRSPRALADELQIPKSTVLILASRLRLLGVPIPKLATRNEVLHDAVAILKKEAGKGRWL